MALVPLRSLAWQLLYRWPYPFVIAVQGADLGKHISGHTLLASLWQKLRPVLTAYCQSKLQDPAVVTQGVLDDLKSILAKREPSGAAWKEMTVTACRYRDVNPIGGADQHLTGDGELACLSL